MTSHKALGVACSSPSKSGRGLVRRDFGPRLSLSLLCCPRIASGHDSHSRGRRVRHAVSGALGAPTGLDCLIACLVRLGHL